MLNQSLWRKSKRKIHFPLGGRSTTLRSTSFTPSVDESDCDLAFVYARAYLRRSVHLYVRAVLFFLLCASNIQKVYRHEKDTHGSMPAYEITDSFTYLNDESGPFVILSIWNSCPECRAPRFPPRSASGRSYLCFPSLPSQTSCVSNHTCY